MTSARWCPICQGAKAPSEEICIACGVTRRMRASRPAVARPQPPMQDRRTKRSRDRASQRRHAIEESR